MTFVQSDLMTADEHAMLEYVDYRRAFPHEQVGFITSHLARIAIL